MPPLTGHFRFHPFGFFFGRDRAVGDGARHLTHSGTCGCRCESGPLQQGDGHTFGTILIRVDGFEQIVLYQGLNQFTDFLTVHVQVFEIIDHHQLLHLTVRSETAYRRTLCNCIRCDSIPRHESAAMKSLPEGVSPCTRSPEFSEDAIPKNLRQSHRTKAGTWGKIVVLEGRLLYRILEPELLETELSPDRFGVVEPEVAHEVAAIGKVYFFIEFHR